MSPLRIALAIAAVALGLASLAAAHDVGAWKDAAGRGSVGSTWLPGDPAGRALALEDDLTLRRGERSFAAAIRPPEGFETGPERARGGRRRWSPSRGRWISAPPGRRPERATCSVSSPRPRMPSADPGRVEHGRARRSTPPSAPMARTSTRSTTSSCCSGGSSSSPLARAQDSARATAGDRAPARGPAPPERATEMALASLSLLTPGGLLVCLTALLPPTTLLLVVRRQARAATTIGLRPASARAVAPLAAVSATACVALGLAAAQPVVTTTETLSARTEIRDRLLRRRLPFDAGLGGAG